uniref:Uncharacterized protein n=1 Tax=Babesia duncani TaxID=323732 RepID=A0A385GNL4_9APIC|nr:hypothetical protein [Babesia duncani]
MKKYLTIQDICIIILIILINTLTTDNINYCNNLLKEFINDCILVYNEYILPMTKKEEKSDSNIFLTILFVSYYMIFLFGDITLYFLICNLNNIRLAMIQILLHDKFYIRTIIDIINLFMYSCRLYYELIHAYVYTPLRLKKIFYSPQLDRLF